MNNKLLKKAFKIIRLSIIVVVLLIAETSSKKYENKIESVNENRTINLTTMALKLEEEISNDLYATKDTYTGDLTGYGANCPLCSGKLGCTGQDVSDGTTIYNDADYGNVRIVASSKNLKCGSIVTFDADYVSGEKVVAIVLDRGVLGTDLDLLVESEDFASKNVGRHKISYDVLRNGWER